MKIDTDLVAAVFAEGERMNEALGVDKDGMTASHMRIMASDLAGRVKATHPRFNAASFEAKCFPLQEGRKKQAILTALGKS